MKKLYEIHNQYIAELERSLKRPIELLTAAKYAAGNHISDCSIEGCTKDNRCNYCTSWAKVWDDIDDYLNDCQEIEHG